MQVTGKARSAAAMAAVAALGLGVAACGGSGHTTKSTPAKTAGTKTTQKSGSPSNKNIVFIQGTKADNFYVTMGCGVKAEAQKLGYNATVEGPADFEPSEQIPIVNAVTATKPAAVLIAPTDEHALISPMEQMKSAGIKLIQVDTTVSDPSIAAASISSNNIAGGKLAADALAKMIGDKGSVVVMNEQAGVSTTEARIQGFTEEMKKYKNITVLPTQFTGDSPSQAAQTVTSLYAAHPTLSGVFATNVLVAEGTDTGLKNSGAASKVKIIGYDADPEQVADLKKGVVQALIAQDPYEEGELGVEQAVNAITGKSTTSTLTGVHLLTMANLAANSQYIYKSAC